MQSLKSYFFYHVLKRRLAQIRALNLSLTESRVMQQKIASKAFRMPLGISTEEVEIRGLKALWIRPKQQRSRGIVLYLHGGAYIQGSIQTSKALAAKLALACSASTLCLEYRLAPEHPYPAALDDAAQAYEELVKSHPGTPIALTGDSAGGGLAVALALRLRDAALPLPVGLALLSPWTDLTLGNATHVSKASEDPFFPNSDQLRKAAEAYAGGHDLKSPFISPQFANFKGMPATLIHVGEREALLDDALVLARQMSASGVHIELQVYPGMWHVWQAFGGRFKEADQSIAGLGHFLNSKLT
jgi:acetyl esterase/lipase